MADHESLLNRWQKAGVLDAEAASRIRAFESEQARPRGLHWQGIVALILGAILLACGVVLFVSAHWDELGPGARYLLVIAMVAVFHLAGGWAREHYHGLSTALHAVGTVATGAAIALVGQIFNIQEHWPGAVLLWGIAAVAGWILLRDEAQQILALLLMPAWLFSELQFAAEGHIGQNVFLGRFLMVWAVLYLTFFLGSKRKAVQGALFAAAAIALLVGIDMNLEGWRAWGNQTYLGFGTRMWGWTYIAVLPLTIALFRLWKSMLPTFAALVLAIALPWCMQIRTQSFDNGPYHQTYTYSVPNLWAHALVAAFAVFIIWWGVHEVSRALVNLGMVGFAISVIWFYFSDIFDKVGRSLGLIGLGVLFLAGGWALERMRRRLIGHMGQNGNATLADVPPGLPKEEAQ
jgi:uncharacterized membrane protein